MGRITMSIPKLGFEYLEYVQLAERPVDKLAEEAGLSEDKVSLLIENGLSRIPVCEQDPAVLVRTALKNLVVSRSGISSHTKIVLLLHSVPGMILRFPSFLERCLRGTTFERTPIVPISGQPCSIFHYGVWLALRYLEQMDKYAVVVLIGIDVAPSVQSRFFFGSSMGDSIVVGSVSAVNVMHRVFGTLSETHVIATMGEDSSPEAIARFRAANPSYIRNAVERCLSQANICLSDVDWIVPHTPYKKMGQIIADVLRFPSDKLLMDYLPDTGHLNSNDSFCHYIRACAEDKIACGDIAVLINPGFGGSRGVTILQRGVRNYD